MHERAEPRREAASESIETLKHAIQSGFFGTNALIDEESLSKLDAESIRSLARISARMPAAKSNSPLLRQGIIDSKLVLNVFANLNGPMPEGRAITFLNVLVFNLWHKPDHDAKMSLLIQKGVFAPQNLARFFSSDWYLLNLIATKSLAWWQEEMNTGRFDPAAINPVNLGMKGQFNDPRKTISAWEEPEPAAWFERNLVRLLTRERRKQSNHYVLHAFSAREHIRELDAQVRQVIPENSAVPPRDALEQIFEFYARRSPQWQTLSRQEEVPESERADNIRSVNALQEQFLRKRGLFPADSRFIDASHRSLDLYPRIDPMEGAGDMDQFQLAIIAKAANWYIQSRHSKLFDRIRIVPSSKSMTRRGISGDMIPWSVKIAAPNAELLRVRSDSFKDSMTFANRFFFTQSNAREADRRGTIPLITWPTFQNVFKHPSNAVVFRAMFNADDRGRVPIIPLVLARGGAYIKDMGKTEYKRTNAAGNIAYLIDETLRVLQELEQKEIARTLD